METLMRVPIFDRCSLLACLVALFGMLSACGGSATGPAPVLSNLTVNPSASYVSTATLTVSTAYDFSDPEGNLESQTVRVLDGAGTTLDLRTEAVPGVAGSVSGTITGSLQVSAASATTYTVQIFATDATSLVSNVVSRTIRVADFPWVTTKTQDLISRNYAASVELNGKVYVMGGQLISGEATSAMTVYDTASDMWTTTTAMPTARMGLVAAAYDGKIYAIGGRTDASNTSAVGTVAVYNPTTEMWSTAISLMPTPRYFAASAVVSNTAVGPLILVAGGESLNTELNVVEGYNPITGAWWGRAALPTARSQLAISAVNGGLYAVGGYGGVTSQRLSTVERYDPQLDTWTTRSPMPTARANLALAATASGQLLAAGGENAAGGLAVLEQYDPVANAWSTKTPSPNTFTRATATVANSRMYVFGDALTLEYNPANEIR
jgi:N-acetylneuraminic acid mutarotase